MSDGEATRVGRPKLKALVRDASQALARLDAARLQELALCCAALNQQLIPEMSQELLPLGGLPPRGMPGAGIALSAVDRQLLVQEAREAVGEIAILARVLEATRANLRVMNRLRELRTERLEYSERAVGAVGGSASAIGNGSGDGDD